MKARFLKTKYQKNSSYRSSSIWLGINDWYGTILQHTFWTICIGEHKYLE